MIFAIITTFQMANLKKKYIEKICQNEASFALCLCSLNREVSLKIPKIGHQVPHLIEISTYVE